MASRTTTIKPAKALKSIVGTLPTPFFKSHPLHQLRRMRTPTLLRLFRSLTYIPVSAAICQITAFHASLVAASCAISARIHCESDFARDQRSHIKLSAPPPFCRPWAKKSTTLLLCTRSTTANLAHNKRWRYLWPLIHYHKFLAKCIKKLRRNGVYVKNSVSPVSVFLRKEVNAVSNHLAAVSHFDSDEWMDRLQQCTGQS
jgi:hypothetical protein